MRRSQVRRLHPAASIVALAISAVPAAASAQDVAQDCSTIADAAERAACTEREATDPVAQSGDLATLPLESQAAQALEGEEGEAIVVTGSRLRRPSAFNSPDPITIIDPELAIRQGVNEVADALQTSPIAAGSTQITTAISSNFVNNGGTGVQTISLRGLGAERTLVLLNGRRAGPSGTRGAVASFDLGVLPLSIVSSTEVLKTGASSIYGSDAVAGVVNILTKKDTDGVELRGFASPTERGGGETYDLSATFGRDFGNGHFLLSASYNRRQKLARGDRDFLGCTEEYIFNPAGERVDIRDPRTNQPTCFNTQGNFIAVIDYIPQILGTTNVQVNGVPVQIIQYNDPGSRLDEFLNPLAPPTNPFEFGSPSGFFPVFYDAPSTGLTNQFSPLERDTSIFPADERITLYADAAYELTPNVELFGEFLYNNRKTHVDAIRQLFPVQFTSDSILPGALFGLPSAGDPLNTGFTGDVILQPVVVSDRFDESVEVNYYRGVVGARGDFGSMIDGWGYEAYVQYSRSDGEYTRDVLFADAFEPQELRTSLCAGTPTTIRGVPCMDINFTDPRVLRGEFTPEEEAFLFGTETGNTKYRQWTGEASVNGGLFNLPAGEVQMAVGGQLRHDEIVDTPGDVTAAGNAYGVTTAGVTAGRTTTLEAFGEIEIPLIHNTPLIENLTFSGAARMTNVYFRRTSDDLQDQDLGNWTYKLGLNWQVTDWLRFRGTYGTSYRAPALFELFLADQTGFEGQLEIDPCLNWQTRLNQGLISQRLANNCAAAGVPGDYVGGPEDAEVTASGGVGVLSPETSVAKTASVIFTPSPFWQGMRFSLAVDYFDINVKGEIAQLGAGNIILGCYASEFYPDEPLCDQFTRAAPSALNGPQITDVVNPFLNINNQVTRGFDVTARLTQDLGSWGDVSLLGEMTWQIEDEIELFEGTLVSNNGEVGDPEWVGNFSINWNLEGTEIFWGIRAVGGTSNLEDLLEDRGVPCFRNNFRDTDVCPDTRLDPTFYHSLSLTQAISNEFELTVGVANLFDTTPPRASGTFTTITNFGQVPALGSYYDYLGRRFFVNASARF